MKPFWYVLAFIFGFYIFPYIIDYVELSYYKDEPWEMPIIVIREYP